MNLVGDLLTLDFRGCVGVDGWGVCAGRVEAPANQAAEALFDRDCAPRLNEARRGGGLALTRRTGGGGGLALTRRTGGGGSLALTRRTGGGVCR